MVTCATQTERVFVKAQFAENFAQHHPIMIAILIIATVFLIAVTSDPHQRINLHKTNFINNKLNIKYD